MVCLLSLPRLHSGLTFLFCFTLLAAKKKNLSIDWLDLICFWSVLCECEYILRPCSPFKMKKWLACYMRQNCFVSIVHPLNPQWAHPPHLYLFLTSLQSSYNLIKKNFILFICYYCPSLLNIMLVSHLIEFEKNTLNNWKIVPMSPWLILTAGYIFYNLVFRSWLCIACIWTIRTNQFTKVKGWEQNLFADDHLIWYRHFVTRTHNKNNGLRRKWLSTCNSHVLIIHIYGMQVH